MANKGLDRKAAAVGVEGKRMLILDQEKCKPMMPAHDFLKRIARSCGRDCITIDESKKIQILEDACLACLNRAKQCPGDAVKIIKLPSNLQTDVTHKYGMNAFKLHGLPTPRPGSVLGLLGSRLTEVPLVPQLASLACWGTLSTGAAPSRDVAALCTREEPPRRSGPAVRLVPDRVATLRLSTPRLGTNGIGKSTALNVLSGKLKPNLGKPKEPPDWHEILAYYRGSELQKYFTRMLEDDLRVSIKVQLDTDYVRSVAGRTVGAVLKERDERDSWEGIADRLDLTHLVDREIQALSGGELQRFAIASSAVRDADCYMFDEASSFLDIKQRMTATELIRSLVFDGAVQDGGVANKYVLVVEHDLAVLDYMSDTVCCLYGEPGGYGVVTKIASVRNGINNFLAGYIPAENMRFRAEELSFVVSGAETADQIASEGGMGKSTLGTVEYPAMSKTLEKAESRFTLHVEPGSFRGAEMIGLLGENGCGKTTFMEMMAGAFDKKADGSADKSVENHSLAGLGVSYKRQHYAPRLRKFPGTVQELFEKTIQNVIVDRLFRLLVLRPLQMEALEKSYVKNLSGGELQRVAITICLGTPATIYLFDEPSAGLDCEQRIIAAKVIRRWVVSNMQKTAFIIEHDFVMASALSDRVIVYDGKPGIECTAKSPMGLVDGFNVFLKQLDVTFRRDPCNFRPRVNKKNSAKDCEQKKSGNYFVFDADEDPVDEADKEKPAPKKKGQSKKG